jgi:N-carbamoylputrescine amidase
MKARCALVQMNFSADVAENLAQGCEYVAEAGRNGAQIVCLPELATTEYFCVGMHPEFLDYAEPIPGPSTERMARVARDANVYVVFPLYEKVRDGELYNSAVFLDRSGEIAGLYRKNMIPLVKVGDVEGNEKFYFRPGNLGYPVWDTDLGIRVGVTICYDRHFPEGPRCLALNGADVMFVPTATPLGGEMWEVELRGHAIANLFWVGAVNRVGRDRDGHFDLDFYGRSLWIAPDGEITEAAGTEGNEVLYCEIDTDVSKRYRDAWGFFRDRRPEVYTEVTAP